MPRLVAFALAIALLALPVGAHAQAPVQPAGDGGAFGSLEPSLPERAAEEAPAAAPMPAPAVPAEPDNGPLSLSESMVFLVIEALLLTAIGVGIAREGGGRRRPPRRERHSRRARSSARTRGAAHPRSRRTGPPPSPRRRHAKAGRR